VWGSGKTMLAKRLGASLGIPVTFLEALYYDEDWKPLPQEEFAERQRSIVVCETWIADSSCGSPVNSCSRPGSRTASISPIGSANRRRATKARVCAET
jgi:hypothetical protein